jgi:type II secretory pathway component GspD/PulD (secretin)
MKYLSLLLYPWAVLSLAAQSTIPLPPQDLPRPHMVDQEAIPEQTLEDLKQMGTPSRIEQPSTLNTYEAEIRRLMDLPSFNLQTNKAPLNDVLTLLADACQMSYVGLEAGLADNVQISVNINKNPYEILRFLSERYKVNVSFNDGIWKFGLYNDEELITRVYRLRYNNQEEATSSGGSSSSSSSGDSSSSSSSSSSGGGEAATFSVTRDVITKDIEKFLALSSVNTDILTAQDFDVLAITELGERGVHRVLPKSGEGAPAAAKSTVIYNSDNQSLYVMATRAQHQWIEKYIITVDKPQKQILVETKIYETGLTPERSLGIDWQGSLTSGEKSITLRGNKEQATLANIAGLGGLTAILDSSDFSASIRALSSDSETSSVQYPRQVTIANRPVSISSVESVPVQQTTTTTDTSDTSQTQTQVEYIDVGTRISILPRIIDDTKVKMDIAISFSSITGYKLIDGNEYPIKAERTYKTQAIVDSGYTLAIGGLKQTSSTDSTTAVPVVSRVPLIGSLFKQRSKTASDKNLLIFISPIVLDEYRGGVKDEPEFVTPRDKDYAQRRTFQGTLDESYTDIMLALGGMEQSIVDISQRIKEGIATAQLKSKVDLLENELQLIRIRLQEIALEQPNKDISPATRLVTQYLRDIDELRRSISKSRSLL